MSRPSRRRRRSPFFAPLLLLLALPGGADGQTWDAPSLVSPYSPRGLSLFLTSATEGAGLGVLAAWRQQGDGMRWGYRAGLSSASSGDVVGIVGANVSGLLADGIEDADVQVLWWTGAGARVGTPLTVSIPAGLVVAWEGWGDGASFAPYGGGHVVLDLSTQSDETATLEAALDLGLDLTLASGWIFRFGAALGGRSALAVGLRIPG